MNLAEGAIGVMDSGVGGVSVLNALRFVLPYENTVYLGDGLNSPYGRKSADSVKRIVLENAERLLEMGCKALVLACNTATAVAVGEVRARYPEIPVVGLEPAVRPALRYAIEKGGDVLILATEVTVAQPRFCSLCSEACRELGGVWLGLDRSSLGRGEGRAPRVFSASAQGLVELIERGEGDSDECVEYLRRELGCFAGIKFSAVVLGCTHFPFARKAIASALGYPMSFFDGSLGAARQMFRLLEKNKITRPHGFGESGWIRWCDTAERLGYAERFRICRRQNIELRTK